VANRDQKREEGFDRALEDLGIRIRDSDQLKVREDVFDEVTLLALFRLARKKWISVMGGPISTGKEANVFLGEREGVPIAIKIYRIRTANFNAMSAYIVGDRRFSNIKRSKKDIVFAWTRKEYANLSRAREAGLPVPSPLVWDRNILLMEFLGTDHQPYHQLRNVELPDPCRTYEELSGLVRILYRDAGLVHADLSEYNILYHERPFLIDMGQSVPLDHPRAHRFLVRDLQNLNRYFSRWCDVVEERKLFTQVTGIDLQDSGSGRISG
jgi:RIO kinase 1